MSRVYMAEILCAAHTAAIDIFEILAGTNKPVALLGWELGYTSEVGDAEEEFITWELLRITGSPTSGSGGNTSAAQPVDPNDGADAATVESGNTTKLSGGTSSALAYFAVNVRVPHLFMPVPEGRILIDQGTRLVLTEATTPADSVTGPYGYVLLEETI